MCYRVCHCVPLGPQHSRAQLQTGNCSPRPVGGAWASSRSMRLIRQAAEAWMSANELPSPLPGSGLKEETSWRWGGAGKAGAPPTLTLAGVPDDATLVCRSLPDPRSNALSWTVTMTQSYRYHPYPTILLPVRSQSSDLGHLSLVLRPGGLLHRSTYSSGPASYLLLQEVVPVYPSQGS